MKPQAPTIAQMKLALNKQGMYSPLEKAAMAVPRSKGTPAEFMAEVSKQPGFRKEEVEDRKITLPEQKMTKDEFLAHIKQHPAPVLGERELGGEDYDEQLQNAAQYMRRDEDASFDDLSWRDQQNVKADIERDYGYNPEPQYDQDDYVLPGGDNYRELLLTLPQRGLTPRERDQKMWHEANARRGDIDPKALAELEALKRKEQGTPGDYQSSHWRDHPNVLAHVRMSDRRGPNGEKILHVEEIQSDWHQEGRKKGYREGQEPFDPMKAQRIKDKIFERFDSGEIDLNQRNALLDQLGDWQENGRKVPDAPFKKNWHELAMKHVLGLAARGGYDGIAITPGDEQAKRWDNEGLKVQYDKTLPNFLNKLGKPHGAQVGTIDIKTPKGNQPASGDEIAQGLGMSWEDLMSSPNREQLEKQFWQARKNATTPVHYFPITDSMRQQITQEGLPQYDRGGKVDPIEALRQQLGPNEPLDPIGNLKRNVTGAWEVLKNVPGNLQRLATDPVAYIRSLPAPTGDQIMNMAGPGNIGFAGMMIGPKARTWHTGRAEMAKAMEEAGRTPQEIWKATGTLKGPDGIWRQEISDKGSTFNMIDDLKLKAQEYKDMIEGKKALLAPDKSGQKDFWPKALTEAKRPIREEISGLKGDLSEMSKNPRTQGVAARWTLEHPELYAAYPALADLPVVQDYKLGPQKGSLTTSGGRLYQMDVNDPRMPRSIALHEMQHAIQNIEGMSPGASPQMAPNYQNYRNIFNKMYRDQYDQGMTAKIEQELRNKAAMQWYERQHGEAEARGTQARRDMSDAERAQSFPYNSYDVNPRDFLTRDPIPYTGNLSEAHGGSVQRLIPDFEE